MKKVELLRQIEELRRRVEALEARPVYVHQPQWIPAPNDTVNPRPWWTNTITYGAGSVSAASSEFTLLQQ
jgi:hypothetical protein